MKKVKLIISCILISIITSAQKFETSLNIAPTMTFGGTHSSQYESKVAFGFSGAVQEIFNITKKFAIGTELNYSNKNCKITMPFYTGYGGFSYESSLNLQTLSLPLLIRYKTIKTWIFQAGYGFTYVMESKLKVISRYTDYWNDNALTITPINDVSDNLKGDFNSYFNFDFGKGFKIQKSDISIQIYFEQTLQDYTYSHGEDDPRYDYKYEYVLRPHLIGLKVGIKL